MADHRRYMDLAFAQAQRSYDQGGLPIGSVLVRGDTVIGQGHNRRIQSSDPIAHGEMDCIRSAGRQATYRDTILYTTLSPCMMCSGTIIQFKIPLVVIGENRNFGENEHLLRQRGVDVIVLDDARCIDLMRRFIRENRDVWAEDIGMGDARDL